MTNALDYNDVKKYIDGGSTVQQAADHFNVKYSTMRSFLEKNDIHPKLGRPRNEEKRLKMPDDTITDIVQKKKRNNAPQFIDESKTTPSEMGSLLNSVMRWWNRPLVRSDDECAERLEEFFSVLAKNGELPTVEKMCLALGTTRSSLWKWENGVNCSPARQAMIRQAKEVLAAMDAELVSQNKIPQVTYIFRAKNFFGMKDQTDVVVTPNNPIGAVLPEEELRKRIEGDVVVDPDAIDADFSE